MEHRYVAGYAPRYILREDGALFNAKGQQLSPYLNAQGYPCVKVYKNGKRTTTAIHRLVAKTFVQNPHPRKYTVVLHLDDDPSNPHKDNLVWGTQSTNMQDMMAKGRGKNQFQLQELTTGKDNHEQANY
ncbi:HNH nuclease [Vibrio phage 1.188.A._10N.286.51.A6]|uniref:HNH nuclease n=4 Tax=Mukerjeevirus TaxID=2733146 RepID=A0A2I7REG8_9CAUD|nr:HNH nuclease [Vibrio phage 1.169.O._10N.261.52.B1]YP_009817481.1 HNH nuclease [Vibrio phage 1.188.A._10N.286.51.A6]AUR93676.1 HNH nuclease [Vibrio phage 1.188.B._10N.286.51.A6]AUR93762.1 HNH nuclease [Vibrio phage 1.188.C._10N.286.51.A6]AUR92039.1 HNH nuclease [Vibrio phage 1.169.O._10N.261.52.B1]AUR93590.1 HNH nuclease [Vibrio phage 1.188.A._10N.286.51.A6]